MVQSKRVGKRGIFTCSVGHNLSTQNGMVIKRTPESIELGASKRRGHNHFHFGKPRTEDEKEKASKSLVAFYKTEEGKEARKRISERLRKPWVTKEQKRKREILWNKNKRIELRKLINKTKEGGCEHCGEKHPACLDWHHVDQNQKETPLSRAFSMGKKKAIIFIEEESKKCIVLCANCHRKLHYDNGTRGMKLGRKT